MKRLLTWLAAAALLLTPFSASMAQTAADMRLEAYTGTVSVTDAGGSPLSPQDGMRLFDGYGLNTGAKSYAWVSLDKTKALKMDALSSVKINKTGRKLNIDLVSGKLLCDVSAPLTDGESLEIRTSTTVTGIRGTVLVVKVIDEYTSVIYVLEGKVTVTETNPETGSTRMIIVTAGQLATSTARSASSGEEGNDVTLRFFTADEVDDFVREEIDRNPAFAEHLRSTDSAEVLKLLEETGSKETGKKPAGDAAPVYVDIVITSASPDIPAKFLDALAGNDYLNLTVSGITNLRPGQDVAVEATQTVDLEATSMDMQTNDLNNAGTINIDAGSELACAGTLTNSSSDTLNVYGKLIINGTLVNTGVINIYGLAQVLHLNNGGIVNILEGGTLEIHGEGGGGDNSITLGSLDNTKDIHVSGTLDIEKTNTASNQGNITVSMTGEFAFSSNIDNSGSITNNGSITNIETVMNNQGTITNDGDIENHGRITNGEGGTIKNNDTIISYSTIQNENGGTITNDGTIANNLGGAIENKNGSTITNNGAIENNDTITNNDGGTITNNGAIENENGGAITNNAGGMITNNDTINNAVGGTITNSDGGTIINDGVVANNGTITNHGDITGAGTITGNEPVGTEGP